MKKYHPLKELFLVRMRTFYREPEAIFWVYGFPLLLAIGLGIAFRQRPPQVITVDIQASPAAETIASQLEGNERFDVRISTEQVCTDRLRMAKTDIVVKPSQPLEYRYDPTRPESAVARTLLDDALQRAVGRTDPRQVVDKTVTEPGARYIDFLIPGLLGMNLMGGGMWGVGYVVTDMRLKKLLRRLLATPMRKSHFLFSLIFGRIVFVLPEIVLLIGAGVVLFGIPVRGGVIGILTVTIVGSLSFAGLGLLVASRAQKLETISGLTNLVMLPMWLFSGVFFSSERFPDAFQPFIQALPLTQLVDALRAVILEGEPLWIQSTRLLILALWGGLSFLLALKWFRWT